MVPYLKLIRIRSATYEMMYFSSFSRVVGYAMGVSSVCGFLTQIRSVYSTLKLRKTRDFLILNLTAHNSPLIDLQTVPIESQ